MATGGVHRLSMQKDLDKRAKYSGESGEKEFSIKVIKYAARKSEVLLEDDWKIDSCLGMNPDNLYGAVKEMFDDDGRPLPPAANEEDGFIQNALANPEGYSHAPGDLRFKRDLLVFTARKCGMDVDPSRVSQSLNINDGEMYRAMRSLFLNGGDGPAHRGFLIPTRVIHDSAAERHAYAPPRYPLTLRPYDVPTRHERNYGYKVRGYAARAIFECFTLRHSPYEIYFAQVAEILNENYKIKSIVSILLELFEDNARPTVPNVAMTDADPNFEKLIFKYARDMQESMTFVRPPPGIP